MLHQRRRTEGTAEALALALSRQHAVEVPISTGDGQDPAWVALRGQPFVEGQERLAERLGPVDLRLGDRRQLGAEGGQLGALRRSHQPTELADSLEGGRVHEDGGKLDDLMAPALVAMFACGLEVEDQKVRRTRRPASQRDLTPCWQAPPTAAGRSR